MRKPLYVITSHSIDRWRWFTYEPSKLMTIRTSFMIARRAASMPSTSKISLTSFV